jgi:hypothetical protein
MVMHVVTVHCYLLHVLLMVLLLRRLQNRTVSGYRTSEALSIVHITTRDNSLCPDYVLPILYVIYQISASLNTLQQVLSLLRERCLSIMNSPLIPRVNVTLCNHVSP